MPRCRFCLLCLSLLLAPMLLLPVPAIGKAAGGSAPGAQSQAPFGQQPPPVAALPKAGQPRPIANPQPQEAKSVPGKLLFWKVASSTGTVYLLGSVHVAKADFYPLDIRIERAFDGCAALAVEADPTAKSALTDQARRLGTYPADSGDSLEKHLSPRSLKKAEALRINIAAFRSLRPWLAALSIENRLMEMRHFQASLGIDLHFLGLAKARGLAVYELEGVEEQLNHLAGLSDTAADNVFYCALLDLEKRGKNEKRLVDLWRAGDEAGMAKAIYDGQDGPDQKEYVERFFLARNRLMAEKIEGFLKAGKPVFAVVGAGHLVGDQGVVGLLRAKGYAVERVGG